MRILVIEDDKKIADILVRALRAEHFAVGVAYDGTAGWQMVSGADYDLIILDLLLPGMSGDVLLGRLREQGNNAAVLVITARTALNEKVKLFEAGADDYLTKPFSLAELVVRVKALLRRPTADRSYTVRVADLEIDRFAQQVRRAGKRIALSSKEYALLEYLAMHTGHALSRAMILHHVWDENFDGLANIVDVYVRHLRTKIDDGFPTKLIHTVRGTGYILEPRTTEFDMSASFGRNERQQAP